MTEAPQNTHATATPSRLTKAVLRMLRRRVALESAATESQRCGAV